MLKNLFLPSPSIEERKSLNNAGLLQVFICYVLYMLAMGVGFYLVEIIILRSAPGSAPVISTVLVSYTLAVFLSLSYVFTLGRRTAKSFGMHKENFGKQYGVFRGIIGNSVLFAAAHLGNSHPYLRQFFLRNMRF